VHAAQIHRQLAVDEDVDVVVATEGKLFAALLFHFVFGKHVHVRDSSM
jgi:hypothetical protein